MQFMEKAETYATGRCHFLNHTLQVGALGKYGEKNVMYSKVN